MFCGKCGSQINDESAPFCPNCGASTTQKQAAPIVQVPNHLVGAILVTLFCCVPCGVAAIVYATKVNSLLSAGDVAGAQAASGKAKMWIMISMGIGIALFLINFLVNFIAAFAQAS